MRIALKRVILYVQDVDRLATFYQQAFGLSIVEEIKGDWCVLDAGPCQLALHRVGKAYRVVDPASFEAETNAKLVMIVDRPLAELRAELTAKGVRLGKIKSYRGFTGLLCDRRDPEGNAFQLAEATKTVS